jgi:acetyl esterase/lipase
MTIPRFKQFSLITVLLVLSACSPMRMLDAVVPDTGYRLVADIAYGADPRQAFDLYLPEASATAKPALAMFFYGGSWKSGRRQDYRFVGQALASRGIAVAIADYRTYPQVQFPAFMEDAAAAAAKLVAVAERHGVDGDRVFLIGHSAGAHMAALLALDERYLAGQGLETSRIAGVVGLAGPYSFDPLEFSSTRPIFETVRGNIDRARPVAQVSNGTPPMLLLHGSWDFTVYPLNTEELTAALRRHGGQVETRYYPGVGHIRIILAFAEPFNGTANVVGDVIDFVRRRAKESTQP